MTTMLEKMISAMFAADDGEPDDGPNYSAIARAALLAIREADETMLRAANAYTNTYFVGETATDYATLTHFHTAMIDAILNEDHSAFRASPVIPTEGHDTPEVGWQPIETAPRDAVLLLFGPIGYGRNDGHPNGSIRACGYWDTIDDAWAFTDTTWEGPFMDPTHWMPLPPPPNTTAGED